jgi:hypothetical protein
MRASTNNAVIRLASSSGSPVTSTAFWRWFCCFASGDLATPAIEPATLEPLALERVHACDLIPDLPLFLAEWEVYRIAHWRPRQPVAGSAGQIRRCRWTFDTAGDLERVYRLTIMPPHSQDENRAGPV